MKPRNKYRKEIMENPPTAFKGLKWIRHIQKCLKKHEQAQAHELQFQPIRRQIIAGNDIQFAQTKEHGIEAREIRNGMQPEIRKWVFDTSQWREHIRIVPIHIVHQNIVLDNTRGDAQTKSGKKQLAKQKADKSGTQTNE